MTSGINLSPKVWGPHAWFFLDSIVISIDNKNLESYKRFFETLKDVLPCAGCRVHYTQYLQENPLSNVKSKDEFLIWLNNLHNKVRVKSGSNKRSLSSVLKYYEKQYGNSMLYPYCVVTMAIIAFVIIFLYGAKRCKA